MFVLCSTCVTSSGPGGTRTPEVFTRLVYSQISSPLDYRPIACSSLRAVTLSRGEELLGNPTSPARLLRAYDLRLSGMITVFTWSPHGFAPRSKNVGPLYAYTNGYTIFRGNGRIRTYGRVAPTAAFQATALNQTRPRFHVFTSYAIEQRRADRTRTDVTSFAD
jgi:hypothetical protein